MEPLYPANTGGMHTVECLLVSLKLHGSPGILLHLHCPVSQERVMWHEPCPGKTKNSSPGVQFILHASGVHTNPTLRAPTEFQWVRDVHCKYLGYGWESTCSLQGNSPFPVSLIADILTILGFYSPLKN